MGKRTLELNMIVHVASEIQFFCLFFLIIHLRAHTLRQEKQTIKYYLAFHFFSICTDNGVFSTLLYRIQFHFLTCHGSFFAGNVVEQRKHKTRQRTQAFVKANLAKTHNKLMSVDLLHSQNACVHCIVEFICYICFYSLDLLLKQK